jgi:hypothetical protein
MATLPEIQPATVSAIWAAREAAAKSWDSIGLSMSELGSDCDRALWLSYRWASKAEKLTGQKLRLFETGHEQERRMIADLRLVPGVTVYDVDPERIGRDGKPAQFKVYSHGGHVRGKLDGKVIGLPEAPKTLHVLECKSHNKKNFDELVKKKVKAAKYAHWLQCQKYMQLEGLTRCLYMAVCKDNDDLYSERLEYDAVAITQLDARLERIIALPQPPSRIAENPDKFPCMFCRQKDVCHSAEFGRRHCRTCVHAIPIVDETNNAQWVCEKFKKQLTVDEQRAGCHAHLFLPDAVPGKQVDAGDDWVAYEMRDGSRWVDQEKKAATEPTQTALLRYWWHPESSALWSSRENEKEKSGSELVEEITAQEYMQAQAHFAAAGK